MIISHKHKYIFIKTEKTAGTSIEIALSKYCGPDDVITPIRAEDEKIRSELNYRGPQNFEIPFKNYRAIDLARFVWRRKRIGFFNHAKAIFVKRHIDPSIWDSYFKFCVERNPWDKAVSMYYWLHNAEPRPSITEFIAAGGLTELKQIEQYSDGPKLLVDKVFMYQDLDAAMREIGEKVGLEETPSLPRAKGAYRKDKRSYRDILSEADRGHIADQFSREIKEFNFQW